MDSKYKVAERNGKFEVLPKARPDCGRSVYDRRENAEKRAAFLNWEAGV